MNRIPLWLTGPQACSYLDDRVSQSAVVDPDISLSPLLYSRLIELGFRRSGDQVYRPHCGGCCACIATRIPVAQFSPDRAQKRCRKRNADTQVNIKPARFDSRHFELYQRYQNARHDSDHGRDISPQDYMGFLGSGWSDTWFVEFTHQQQLLAVAVVDVVDNGLSAVYTFFEPDSGGLSPGVFAVLWQIEQAKIMQLDFLYLGFWIKDCRKMRYKNQYQPLQGLINQQWQPIY